MDDVGDRLSSVVSKWSRETVAVMLVLSLLLGSGVTEVDGTASLEQFETDSEVAEKQSYVEDHFGTDGQTTTAQIIVEGDDVLAKDALLATIRLQERFRANETVNATLAEDPFDDPADVVAETAIRIERGEELQTEAAELRKRADELNGTREELEAGGEELETRADELNETREELETRREELQGRADELNGTREELEADRAALERRADELNGTREELEADRAALERRAEALRADAEELAADAEEETSIIPIPLPGTSERQQALADRRAELEERREKLETDRAELERRGEALRERADELETDRAELERRGEALRERADELAADRDELEADAERLESRADELEASRDELEARSDTLEARAEELEAERANLDERRGELADLEVPLDERREQLESMNQSEIDDVIETVLEDSDGGSGAYVFLPTDFEAGSTSADARTLFVTQETRPSEANDGGTSDRIIEAQLAMEAISKDAIGRYADGGAVSGDGGAYGGVAAAETNENRTAGTAGIERPTGTATPTSTETDRGNGTAIQTPAETDRGNGTAAGSWGADSGHGDANVGGDRDGAGPAAALDRAFVFSEGLVFDEIDRSMVDSFVVVLPLSLLFVLLVLTVAYRDVLDILLGVFGILTVLLWTFGFMGWTGLEFNQVMIAVPVFLVGLSIDYAIHVFMRHREQNTGGGEGSRPAMGTALGGVGVALVWVTATGAIGFLSNLTSTIQPLRAFGIVGAFGIVAAMAVFTLFVPALKVELDELLKGWGIDREKRAFGTEGGAISAFLDGGRRIAAAAPWAAVVVALLLTTGGVAGAVQLDTSFKQTDLIADEPADWMTDLPEPFASGTYTAKEDMEYVNERFVRQDARGRVLVEGRVARNDTPQRVASTLSAATDRETVLTLPDGRPEVTDPLSVMRDVAAVNATFNESFVAADRDGDGVPEKNVEGLYDELFVTAPDRAAEVIHRTDGGDYEAIQLIVSARGGAPSEAVAADMRSVADEMDGDGLEATATGQLVVFDAVEEELFETVVQSLLVTLVAVFVFLMVGYRRAHESASLGFVTLVPIVLSVAWILGTMYLLDIPFNVLTGTVASLTVGLGIDYNIHMTERYVQEREDGHDVQEALSKSVTGTGGALFGSAVTTAGGFGVLGFAILPALQQFAVITALTIVYAFLGSVFLLPSLLVIWARTLGPGPVRRGSKFDPVDGSPESPSPGVGPAGVGTGPRGGAHERRLVYERLGLSADEAVVFATLQSFDGASTERLADLLGRDRTAVSEALETLEWYGLLETGPGDPVGYRPIAHEAAVAWLSSETDIERETLDEPESEPERPPAAGVVEAGAD